MSVPSWARVGAKVVAVGRKGVILTPAPLWAAKPQAGTIYTIRAVSVWYGQVGIYLAEIVNGPLPSGDEPGWLLRCFRPVHTLRGDVRAIKSMLREMPAETRLDRLLEALDE